MVKTKKHRRNRIKKRTQKVGGLSLFGKPGLNPKESLFGISDVVFGKKRPEYKFTDISLHEKLKKCLLCGIVRYLSGYCQYITNMRDFNYKYTPIKILKEIANKFVVNTTKQNKEKLIPYPSRKNVEAQNILNIVNNGNVTENTEKNSVNVEAYYYLTKKEIDIYIYIIINIFNLYSNKALLEYNFDLFPDEKFDKISYSKMIFNPNEENFFNFLRVNKYSDTCPLPLQEENDNIALQTRSLCFYLALFEYAKVPKDKLPYIINPDIIEDNNKEMFYNHKLLEKWDTINKIEEEEEEEKEEEKELALLRLSEQDLHIHPLSKMNPEEVEPYTLSSHKESEIPKYETLEEKTSEYKHSSIYHYHKITKTIINNLINFLKNKWEKKTNEIYEKDELNELNNIISHEDNIRKKYVSLNDKISEIMTKILTSIIIKKDTDGMYVAITDEDQIEELKKKEGSSNKSSTELPKFKNNNYKYIYYYLTDADIAKIMNDIIVSNINLPDNRENQNVRAVKDIKKRLIKNFADLIKKEKEAANKVESAPQPPSPPPKWWKFWKNGGSTCKKRHHRRTRKHKTHRRHRA